MELPGIPSVILFLRENFIKMLMSPLKPVPLRATKGGRLTYIDTFAVSLDVNDKVSAGDGCASEYHNALSPYLTRIFHA